MIKVDERSYQSYLLRIWRTDSYGEQTWRCMLQDPQTGQQRGFADLDALCAFLRRQIDGIADTETGGGRQARETKREKGQ